MDRYKRRGPIFQPGTELQRELRAHRRSLNQRRSRQDLFDSTRNFAENNHQILESVTEDDENKPLNVQATDKSSVTRSEMFKRWKAEKDLKKKLEAQRKVSKPAFKVCRIIYEPPAFLLSKESVSIDKRLTRAAAKALAAPTMTLRSSSSSSKNLPTNKVLNEGTTKKRIRKGTKIVTEQAKNMKKTQPKLRNDVSFAPANYEFVPIAGISSFALTAPLSPKTADSFLFPISTVDEHAEVEKEEPIDNDGVSSPEATTSEGTENVPSSSDGADSVVPMEVEVKASPPFKTPSSAAKKRVKISPLIDISPFINRERRSLRRSSSKHQIPLDLDDDLMMDVAEVKSDKPDVSQFRELLRMNTDRLTSLCDDWNRVLNDQTAICDSVVGRIRSAVGKANLLMSERFEQFTELVDDCELVRGEKVTTCDDLQGFWDMIHLQVENVIEQFGKLDRIRRNDFEDEETPIKKAAPKKVKVQMKAKAKKTDSDDRSRAARQRLADFKAKAVAKMRRKTEELNVDKFAQLCVASPSSVVTETVKTPRKSLSEVSSSPSSVSRGSRRRASLRHSILQKNFLDSSITLETKELQSPIRVKNSKTVCIFSPLSPDPLPLALQAVNLSPFQTSGTTKHQTRRTDLIRFSDVHDPINKENLEDSLSRYLEPSFGNDSFN